MHTPRWSEVGEKAASPETFPLWKDLSILISRFSRLYKSTFTFASSIPLSRDQQTKLSLGCVAFKAFKAFSSVWHSSQSSAKGGEIHINRQLIKMRAIATNLYIWRVSQLFREVFLPWKFCLDEYLESLHCRPCSRVVLNSVNFFVCN